MFKVQQFEEEHREPTNYVKYHAGKINGSLEAASVNQQLLCRKWQWKS